MEPLTNEALWDPKTVPIDMENLGIIGLNVNRKALDPAPAETVVLECADAMDNLPVFTNVPGRSGRPPKVETGDKVLDRKNKERAIKNNNRNKYRRGEHTNRDDGNNLLRSIGNHAANLRLRWRPAELSNLPELSLPPKLDIQRASDVLIAYRMLWDWQDECLSIGRKFIQQEPPPVFDFSSFEAAFGSFARLESLDTANYQLVREALEQRRSSTSTSIPNMQM